MKANFTLKVLVLLCAVLLAFQADAQVEKFGKVTDEEMAMKSYSQDTSAAAVVLFDKGNIFFIYSERGFEYVFQHHKRIKVLKKAGYEWANMAVPYYRSGSGKENVSGIKGFTYNQNGSKIDKDKLGSSGIFDEKVNDNWSQKKITMPNVKEGSVIDIYYEIRSDFLYNLRDWEFQTTIPVVHSEFKVRIPEYFVYKTNQQGYLSFTENKQTTGRESFMVPRSTEKIDVATEEHLFVIKDAPALREEKYISSLKDYQSKLSYELQVTKFPGSPIKMMTGNWKDVTNDLLNDENFGRQLKRRGAFKDVVASLVANNASPAQKVVAIHALVKNNITWSGGYGNIYAMTSLPKVYENKKGTASEINLLLTAMLQEAGLDASPVILSTRDNGRIMTAYSPMLSKFNYVVAHVSIDGKDYLLDATDPFLPANMLPVRCLNGEGRLIKENDQRWIPLNPTQSFTKFVSTEVSVSEQGEVKGKIVESATGYNALLLRKSIKEDGEEKFAEQLAKESSDYKLSNATLANVNDIASALSITYDLSATGNNQSNDIIYLNPLLGQGEAENPFKLVTRMYPVDFAAPIDETFITKLTIPAGYVIDEMPESIAVSLPENTGRFSYVLQQTGNQIELVSRISISKPVFYAEEYPYLKEFYNQVVAKHAEQIVLKKASN